jgi:dTDP-4-amino-4,6-dideoxygalactose transaminase
MSQLAIYGGPKTITEDEVKSWPPVDTTDEKLVLEALHSKVQARGNHNLAFEDEFCKYNGNKYALFTNSGTAALHMCLVGCGIGAGDHVLVTAYSWSSSATCILHHNAIPIFVDIDFDTFLIDAQKIEEAITPRTKAIIVVQLHGLCADMDAINAIAKKHNLYVIEDACQAHGAMYKGQKAGTMGDCAAFSLNQNKCLSSGEGGIFVTDNEAIFKDASKLWSFGETSRPEQNRDYHAYALGWMYRNNELTAAYARAQLAKYPYYFKQLRDNGNLLHDKLKGIKGLMQPYVPKECVHNWYNYNLRLDFDAIGVNGSDEEKVRFRDALCAAIRAEGVAVSIWQRFILPEMTVFKAKNAYGGGFPWSIPGADENVDYCPTNFPNALKYSRCHMSIVKTLRAPNGLDIAQKVVDAVKKVFENIDEINPDKILKN